MSREESSEEVRLSVLGMSCAGCVSAVEGALSSVPGVTSVSVNFADHSAQVKGHADPDQLVRAVKDAGYDAALVVGLEDPAEEEERELQRYRELMKKAAVAGGFGALLMIMEYAGGMPDIGSGAGQWFWPEVAVITLGILVYSGWHFYTGAVKALSLGQANMDTLIALGTGSAWLYSCIVIDYSGVLPSLAKHAYFEAAVVILAFINLGSGLETRARGQDFQRHSPSDRSAAAHGAGHSRRLRNGHSD